MIATTALHEKFPYFAPEHEMLRQTVRRFVDEQVLPHGDAWEEAGQVPRAVLREMGGLGLLGIRFDAEYGGSELDTLSTVVYAEELGRSTYGGFAITALVHTDMAAPHLHHAGNAEQKKRLMPDIVSGKRIAAVAMTEPDAGSDLASMRTTARRDGDHWVLNGAKMFITNGVHGDIFFVAAKTGEAGRNHQISMFIVEKEHRVSVWRDRSGSMAGCPATRPSWCSTTAAFRWTTCSGRSTGASMRWSRICRMSASCWPPRPWAKPPGPLS